MSSFNGRKGFLVHEEMIKFRWKVWDHVWNVYRKILRLQVKLDWLLLVVALQFGESSYLYIDIFFFFLQPLVNPTTFFLSATFMATSLKINQIVRLKQVMKKWKAMSMKLRHGPSPDATDTDTDSEIDTDRGASTPRTPSGFLAVYVASERERFLVPTRYVNLPVFVTLLKRAEEEHGFKFSGGIVVPCEVGFFRKVLEFLEKDEKKFGSLELDEFVKMFSEVGFDSSCKTSSYAYNINTCHDQFTHLMHKAS